MKKNIFLSCACIVMAFCAFAQTEPVIGKWKFKDIYEAEKIDSSALQMLKQFFGEVTMYFKANKHYSIDMMKKDEGTWTYDNSSKKLTITSINGSATQMEVISVTDKTLVISIAKGKSFILEKTIPTKEDEMETPVKEVVTVAATAKQICRKWYVIKRSVPGKTEEETNMLMSLVKGAYFDFKENGNYQAQVLMITDNGTWQFGEGNKSIILTVENEKKIWKIKSITADELVLVRGNTEDLWTLSTKLPK